jgi:glycerophosphoryl diester phosphodiesterase
MFQFIGQKTLMLLISTALIGVQWIFGPSTPKMMEFQAMDSMKIIAHRGASGQAPENTLSSFKKAVTMKADYIEVDIQCTLDQRLVVIHDTAVDRTTNGYGQVKDMSFQDLKSLDAGSYFHPSFAGESIPSLEEVFDEFADEIGILLDLKDPALCPGIEILLANFLVDYGLDQPANDQIIVQSFDTAVLKAFHSILPSVPIGVLLKRSNGMITDQQLSNLADYADFVNPHHALVSREFVEQAHHYEMKVIPWTIRNKQQYIAMAAAKVDGIITDYPDLDFN